MAKISVIVPIYNSEKTLRKCLDSILSQTLDDIEVLCIDDESKDNSRSIVDEYAQNDSRIIPIHLSGKGSYGRAVNLGIEKASAEFIGIVETDDWIKSNMYEVLYNLILKKQAQVAVGSYYVMKNLKTNKWEYCNSLKDNILLDDETFNISLSPNLISKTAYPWKNLYSKEFLLKYNIKFREDFGGSYQDQIFNAEILSHATEMVGTTEPLYYYNLDNDESSTNNGTTNILYPLRRIQTRDVLLNNKVFNNEVMEYFWHQTYIGLMFFFKRTKNNFKPKYYNEMRKLLKLSKTDNLIFKYFDKKEKKIFNNILNINNYYVYSMSNLILDNVKFSIGNVVAALYENKFLLSLLDNFIPKNSKKVLFFASPDFGDNTKAFYDYLLTHSEHKFNNFVFLYKNKWWKRNLKNYKHLFLDTNTDIKCEYKPVNSISGLWSILTSKNYVINERFLPHMNYLSNKHIVINLWHGMTIKTIGYIEKHISQTIKDNYKWLGENSYLFATSDIFKALLSNSFMTEPNKIFITGQPKTDCILDNDKFNKVKKLFNLEKYNKVILYTPTYKEFCRAEDIKPMFKNIFYCDDYNENDFYSYLEKNNILLIFKPHLFDESFYERTQGLVNFEHSNIKFINDLFLKENNIALYEIFKYVDVLISDFSSITVDFAISKKPIIYLLSDKKSYADERGMSLEDNYEIFMPGFKVNNYGELKNAITDSLTTNSKNSEFIKSLPLLHKHVDSSACKRIWEIMKGLIK